MRLLGQCHGKQPRSTIPAWGERRALTAQQQEHASHGSSSCTSSSPTPAVTKLAHHPTTSHSSTDTPWAQANTISSPSPLCPSFPTTATDKMTLAQQPEKGVSFVAASGTMKCALEILKAYQQAKANPVCTAPVCNGLHQHKQSATSHFRGSHAKMGLLTHCWFHQS